MTELEHQILLYTTKDYTSCCICRNICLHQKNSAQVLGHGHLGICERAPEPPSYQLIDIIWRELKQNVTADWRMYQLRQSIWFHSQESRSLSKIIVTWTQKSSSELNLFQASCFVLQLKNEHKLHIFHYSDVNALTTVYRNSIAHFPLFMFACNSSLSSNWQQKMKHPK